MVDSRHLEWGCPHQTFMDDFYLLKHKGYWGGIKGFFSKKVGLKYKLGYCFATENCGDGE